MKKTEKIKERYILRLMINNKLHETAEAGSWDGIQFLIESSDASMSRNGYRRVGYTKTRFGPRHTTTVTVTYTRV